LSQLLFPSDIERATASLADQRDVAAFFPPDITTQVLRREIVALVARYRLPAIYPDELFVKVGGLASYSADRLDIYRRAAASYVDRILRGVEKVFLHS
jgi:putative ABC transport system substrate-binding protein